jgi:hypothetical protein
MLVRFFGNAVLMNMVIHLDEITQRNFLVSLGSRQDAGEQLIRHFIWRQRQTLPSSRDDFI